MTRVIAGQFKGRRLSVPDTVTRPTSSRVREAVLSSVEHAVAGFTDLAVLDLFAGSGALGIEALSRGAESAVFVDNDASAVAAVRANLAAVGANSATVVRADVAVLLVAENPYGHFDVVFADPPYATDDARVNQLLAALVTGGWLAFDALVVLERPTKSQPTWPDGFTDVTKRGYGDTSVWYGRFEVT